MKEKNELQKAQISPELVAKAKAGDQNAFSELYQQTSTALYRSIHSMVHDDDTAWDIQQETYLKAFQNLNKLDHNEAFLTWLRRISVNITATEMSKRLPTTFTDLGEPEDDEPEVPDPSIDTQPELALDKKETSRLVREILAELPEEQHLIVGMRYYEDLGVKEIAELLHLSQSTVKTQLARGRKRVEASVRALEKQGLKLYGLSPMAFLVALMRRAEPMELTKQAAIQSVVTKAAGGTAGAAGTKAAVVTAYTSKQMLRGMIVKTLIGAVSVAAIAGGIWAGARLLDRDKPMPYQPTETVDIALLRSSTGNTLVTPPEIVTESEADVTVPATEPEGGNEEVYAGACGEHLTWRFDPETGLLTIEGYGAMEVKPDFPWRAHSERIRAVELPEGLTSIDLYAFSGCSALTSITIPDSVTNISGNAFYGCSALASVTIPASVTSIGDGAFTECSALTSLTISDGVTSIGDSAFSDCGALTSVTIPASVTSMDRNVFYNCGALTDVTFSNGAVSVSAGMFRDCAALRRVTIPASVTGIGDKAFYGCGALTSVSIDANVTSIGDGVFGNCGALTEIQVAGTNPNYVSLEGVLYNRSQSVLLQYPAGKQEASFAIPASVTHVGGNAFSGCAALTNVTIPTSVTSIGDEAFYGCGALADVTLPDGLASIGSYAFRGCEGLTSVTIPDSVTSIGNGVFGSCTSLKRVSIGSGVRTIAIGAFSNCAALERVTIGGNVKTIDSMAFNYCTALKDVTLGSGVQKIGYYAFCDCTGLTSVSIGSNVTSIDNYAFGWYSTPTDEELRKVDGFTVHAPVGSAAQTYAEENGFAFAALDAAAG